MGIVSVLHPDFGFYLIFFVVKTNRINALPGLNAEAMPKKKGG